MDNDLKWKSHTFHSFKSGSFFLKSFSLLKQFSILVQNLKIIYCSYIRPCLEYALPVWYPGLTNVQCSKIERIQKRAIKIVLGISYTSYNEGLARLELATLESQYHILTMNFGTSALVLTIINIFFPPSKKIPQSFLIQDLILVELQIPNLTCVPKCWWWGTKILLFPILFCILIIDLTLWLGLSLNICNIIDIVLTCLC